MHNISTLPPRTPAWPSDLDEAAMHRQRLLQSLERQWLELWGQVHAAHTGRDQGAGSTPASAPRVPLDEKPMLAKHQHDSEGVYEPPAHERDTADPEAEPTSLQRVSSPDAPAETSAFPAGLALGSPAGITGFSHAQANTPHQAGRPGALPLKAEAFVSPHSKAPALHRADASANAHVASTARQGTNGELAIPMLLSLPDSHNHASLPAERVTTAPQPISAYPARRIAMGSTARHDRTVTTTSAMPSGMAWACPSPAAPAAPATIVQSPQERTLARSMASQALTPAPAPGTPKGTGTTNPRLMPPDAARGMHPNVMRTGIASAAAPWDLASNGASPVAATIATPTHSTAAHPLRATALAGTVTSSLPILPSTLTHFASPAASVSFPAPPWTPSAECAASTEPEASTARAAGPQNFRPAHPENQASTRRLTFSEPDADEVLAVLRDSELTSPQSQHAARELSRALMQAGYARVQVIVNGWQEHIEVERRPGERADEAATTISTTRNPSPAPPSAGTQRHDH